MINIVRELKLLALSKIAMEKYKKFHHAQLDKNYLHTNSTTHNFVFGAIAELVDNSRDANANSLKIWTQNCPYVSGDYFFNFLDDGEGMDHEEAKGVIVFGRSYKQNSDLNLIGQYGNGLKSSSMRIGRDLIIFTKRNGVQSCILMARSFLDAEIDNGQIYVPIPVFDSKTNQPLLQDKSLEIHNDEMDTIRRYSPFRTDHQIKEQFDKIQGESGTLIICYNIHLQDDQQTEFDIETDPQDILLRKCKADFDNRNFTEHNSFRSYVSILYHDPKMKIYIQGKKVRTKILERTLYYPLKYKFVTKKFKTRIEKEKSLAEQKLQQANDDLRHKTSALSDFHKRYNPKKSEDCKLLAQKRKCKEEAESIVQTCKLRLERASKDINEPKALNFMFGINVNNRAADGLFIYNCNRLILMYQHTKQQSKGTAFRGIVGVVEVPRLVLEPTHNKQSFIDLREQNILINELGNYMENYYLKDLMKQTNKALNLEFWRPFGYDDMDFNFLPSDEDMYKRKRMQSTTLLVQCDVCLKWREIAWNRRNLDAAFPLDNWECKDNYEIGKDNCRLGENLGEIKLKELRRSNDEIILTEKPQQISRGFSLIQTKDNIVVNKSVPPTIRDTESATKFIQRKRYLMSTDQEETDSESENSNRNRMRDDRRRDPDFNPNRNSNSSKKSRKSTNIDEAKENQVHNIFNDHIIVTENLETLERIKIEPSDEDSTIRCIENRTSDKTRYSFESGIDINNLADRQSLQFSPRVQNSFRDDIVANIKNNHKNLLLILAKKLNDDKLVQTIYKLNDIELSQFSIEDLMESIDKKDTEVKNNEMKKMRVRHREKTVKVLVKKLGQNRAETIIDEIYPSAH